MSNQRFITMLKNYLTVDFTEIFNVIGFHGIVPHTVRTFDYNNVHNFTKFLATQ